MHRQRPRTLVAMDRTVATRLLTGPVQNRLTELVDVDPRFIATDFHLERIRSGLAATEVLLTSWGCPALTDDILAAAPGLRAIVHAGGTVKPHVTEACWQRGIRVSSAAAANAEPVAEYTIATILLANKRVFEIARHYRHERGRSDYEQLFPGLGNYRKTVGIIGASKVGRRVMALLRSFDFDVVLADPYVHEDEARSLGARLTTVDELVTSCDVVSVHAPDLPETRNLIGAAQLAKMRDGTILINTARPALIDGQALTEELESGRLHAVLDVTEPEPLAADSVLYDLPNVLVTPHVAGSMGGELSRMAKSALDELERYTHGLPFAHPVKPEDLARSA